jgi:hypothetical protein
MPPYITTSIIRLSCKLLDDGGSFLATCIGADHSLRYD